MAATGPLSPSMIMAGKGIVPDIGGSGPTESEYTLGINPKLGSIVYSYLQFIGALGVPNGGWRMALRSESEQSGVSMGILLDRGSVPSPKAPPISGRIPFAPELMPTGGISITDLFIKNARLEMCYDDPTDYELPDAVAGPRDLTKFTQFYGACAAYRTQANEMINSTTNTDVAAQTFAGMAAMSTGSVSCMSTSFKLLAEDLTTQGNLVDFRYLDYLGYPSFLIKQMLNVGSGLLPAVYDALVLTVSITIPTLLEQLNQSTKPLELSYEKEIYQALLLITQDGLSSVKELLDVTTPNLATAADLLDPKKIFPKSYKTLMIQSPGYSSNAKSINKMIYLPSEAVDTTIEPMFATNENYLGLKKVIPADQALANTALVRSYSQIKNIKNIEFPAFAKSVGALQNDNDLPAVQNMTAPITSTVGAFYGNNIAEGSGPDKSTTLRDFMGVAAGYPLIGILEDFFKLFSTPSGKAQLAALKAIFATMVGDYDPETGLPLVLSAVAVWNNIVGNIPGLENVATKFDNDIGGEISRNVTNYTLAGIVYDADVDPLIFQDLIPKSRPPALAFISGIHQLGADITDGGANDIFINLAQPGTEEAPNIYGQNFLNALREGGNNQALQDTGVATDNQMSSQPSVVVPSSTPPANT